ncbi:mechanosensitive ion channel protein 10-like [Mercurialis annua]|uniref:mechanosensitive ion channel protein 10-like n=1 Tax=Mercurialis annua TaxID=3986 RepID=UPI00215FB3A0|nr:mechanosensitive ion channel protein 10-like [Mercurialis annua]
MAEVTSKDCNINMKDITRQVPNKNDPVEALTSRNGDSAQKIENIDEEPEEKGTSFGIFMFFIILESAALLCVMGVLISSLTVEKLKKPIFWSLGIWKWCLLALSILCGRLISYLLTEATLFLIWTFWLDEKVLYFAYGVKKSVMFFIWLSLVTLAWGLLSTLGVNRSKETTEILHDVTKGLGGCLIGAALWLLKTLFVKLIGSLHATKLFQKIREAIRLRKVVLALSVLNMSMEYTGRKKSKSVSVRFTRLVRAFSIADIDDIDSEKQKGNKVSIFREKVAEIVCKMGLKKKSKEKADGVSTHTMIELINAIRGKKLIPLTYITTKKKNKDGAVAYGNNINEKMAKALRAAQEITDEAEAKIAANDLFSTLAGSEDAGYLDLETLLEFVKDEKVKDQLYGLAEDKCKKTEALMTIAENEQMVLEPEQSKAEGKQSNIEEKHIKKSVFRNWVVDIYRDHDSLNNTLKHSKTAIDELNVIASVIVLFIITVMWLIFMEFLPTKLLLFLSSQLLLVAFMFGNTVKTVFEAVIFVFVVHPFDVGDRCVIQGVQMVVDEMNILTTTFLRFDGEKIYYPNSVLSVKPISNFYRSPPMMDTLEFAIDLRTPTATIEQLQEKIKTYLEDNPRRWRHDHSVQFKEIEDVNKMKVAVFVNHTINFQNIGKKGKRRSELVLEMKRIFEELRIEYHLLPQPVHLMNYAESTASQVPFTGKQPYY